MPFTREEARDWASRIAEGERDASLSPNPAPALICVLDDLVEAIGRDAEAAGWYGDWERMLDETGYACERGKLI